PSSTVNGVPGWQDPPPHTSWPLQTVASSHAEVLFVCCTPVIGSRESSVQTFPSLTVNGVPALQVPPPHTSWPLQTVASSQLEVLFVCCTPVIGSQLSS